MTDRYERIRKALEGLRERCAREAERITGRRRTVAAMISNEAVKPCEVAAAIRKIDVQQHYECAVAEIERMRTEIEALRKERDALRGALEEAEDAMRFVHTSCATFPQEPQHIQNAAWRRIVNVITKARAALAKEDE